MMRLFTAGGLVALALAGAMALAAESGAGAAQAPATRPSTQPVNKMCAVRQNEAADPAVTYSYKGKVYAFCCSECIPEFKKAPEKYAKAR